MRSVLSTMAMASSFDRACGDDFHIILAFHTYSDMRKPRPDHPQQSQHESSLFPLSGQVDMIPDSYLTCGYGRGELFSPGTILHAFLWNLFVYAVGNMIK